jgi:hypothetical protein
VHQVIHLQVFNPTREGLVGEASHRMKSLQGRVFRVYGVRAAVYNLVSEATLQVNSRFVLFDRCQCALLPRPEDTQQIDDGCSCSYSEALIGELSFQQLVHGVIHSVLIMAGDREQGFAWIEVDEQRLSLGRTVTFDSFSITLLTSHSLHITTEHFDVQLKNSHAFITLDWRAKVPLSTLHSHGLVGQTYTNDTFLSSSMHIEGEAEDYVEAYDNIFGHHFVYNRFLVQATSQQDDGK